MTRMPLPERLALRRARRDWRGTLIAAVFLAVPFTALVVANIVTSATPDSATILTSGTWLVVVPFLIAIVVMIAANALVATRRDERMLALLRSAGASRGSLFRFVSAGGVLSGLAAAVLAVAVGITLSWLWRGQIAPVSPGPVIGIAVLCLVLGWAASVVPGIVASAVDANRVLRGLPRATSGQWRTDRIGAVIVLIGVVALVLGFAVVFALREATLGDSQPSFWAVLIGGFAGSALAGVAPMLLVIGLALMMPRLFRMIGMATKRFGLAARLASRDAERSWSRSVSAGAAVLVTMFAIASYVSLASVSTADAQESHRWELQEGQFAVSLIDLGYANDVFDPRPVSNPDEIAASVADAAETDDLRILQGVQGPYYGAPVEDFEGYSGRQEMRFPEGGLPHPRLAEPPVCDVEELDAWRCEPAHHYDSLAFPLRPGTPTIWVGDAADLSHILGGTVDTATLESLASGEALVFDTRYLAADGTVSIDWHGEDFVPEDEPGEFLPRGEPLRSVTLDGHLVHLDHPIDYGVFLHEESAEALGLEAQPSRILGTLTTPPEQYNNYDTYAALGDAVGTRADVIVESGPPEPEPGWVEGALIIGGGISLAVALIASGLARLEGRHSDRTLASLGASPDIRRRISGWYVLTVVGTASVLGTAAGMLWAGATVVSFGSGLLGMPWVELGVLAVGVPVLAAALARVVRVVRTRG